MRNDPAHRLWLIVGGFLLLAMAFIALVIDRGVGIVGLLASLGAAVLVVSAVLSALGPRMSGKQEFKVGAQGINWTITLAEIEQIAVVAEEDLASGKPLRTLEEYVAQELKAQLQAQKKQGKQTKR